MSKYCKVCIYVYIYMYVKGYINKFDLEISF